MSKFQTKIIKEYENKGFLVLNIIRLSANGYADLLALKAGSTPLFIEVKEKNDTVKPLQKYRQKELKRLGFESIIIKDV